MKLRPRVRGPFFIHAAIGVVLLRAYPLWPWGNGDHPQVPGRDRPGRGVMVQCKRCGYSTYLRRVRYSTAPKCPACRKGRLKPP
jgi:hypothetical protein